MNHILDGSTARHFTLTRFVGYLGPLMAEYVVGQVIAHERQFAFWGEMQRQRRWTVPATVPPYRPLASLTLGILGGLGDIGQAIARAANALGMRVEVLAHQPRRIYDGVVADTIYDKDSGGLAALLAAADYLVAVLPSTPATRGMLTASVLRACTKRPVFINVGRGDLIAPDEVIAALNHGSLRYSFACQNGKRDGRHSWVRPPRGERVRSFGSHAILDVFAPEPLHADSPLWTHP